LQEFPDNVFVDFDLSLGLDLELHPDLLALEIFNARFHVKLQGFGELGDVHVDPLLNLSGCFITNIGCTVFDVHDVQHELNRVFLGFFIRLLLC